MVPASRTDKLALYLSCRIQKFYGALKLKTEVHVEQQMTGVK